MLIPVTQADFERADAALPADAFPYMRSEFAANYALQRAFPGAQVIKVDRHGIEVDGRHFLRPWCLYRRLAPYDFPLTRNRWRMLAHRLFRR